ncbi:glycine zipper domain-containing protein [Paraburkholderia sartisoli]|nr:hypothetical protein [Paraburkholderia sartisoli]
MAADNTDRYVRDTPWQTLGIGTGMGFFAGRSGDAVI